MRKVSSERRNILISAFFTLFGGPGIVLVYAPWLITRFRVPVDMPVLLRAIARVMILVGLIPLLESIWRFIRVGKGTLVPAAPPQHLVVSGIYQYVRNPMYVGVLLVLAGEILLFQRWAMVVYSAVVWLVIHLFVCFYEERKLAGMFGDEYLQYKSHVRRWLPRLRLYGK